MIKKLVTLIAIIAAALVVWAVRAAPSGPGIINFVWPASTTTNVAYWVYYGSGSTNLTTNVLARVNTGTNLTYMLSNTPAGSYWSYSTAHDPVYTNVESAPAGIIRFTVPTPPGFITVQ